jgi:RNA polymerase sigma factor (TIGR02999 family)
LIEFEDHPQEAAQLLFEVLYNELRRMAQRHLQSERSGHTLQATALVHEAYLRLVGVRQTWRNRAHFFAIASSAMRRILVDHARAKNAAKRPDAQQQIQIGESPLLCIMPYDDVIALDLALQKLSQIDSRQGRIVELRYFGGLTSEEAAEALGISAVTVQRE